LPPTQPRRLTAAHPARSRVARRGAFIMVDAYRNEAERERMFAWDLPGRTIMSVDEWIGFFAEAGYSGDYYWFIP
jgi:hypothetical protein